MSMPADFDAKLWPDPLLFQGLVGFSIARGKYRDLFREDGFCKSTEDLMRDPETRRYLLREIWERDRWRREHYPDRKDPTNDPR